MLITLGEPYTPWPCVSSHHTFGRHLSARASAATWDVAILLAPKALGNLGMLADASIYPTNPYFSQQSVHLCHMDHCRPHFTQSDVKPVCPIKVGPVQRPGEWNNLFLFLYSLVKVPNIEGLFRDQGFNLCPKYCLLFYGRLAPDFRYVTGRWTALPFFETLFLGGRRCYPLLFLC